MEALEDRRLLSTYLFETIDDPLGGNGTNAFGIDSAGQVVGRFHDSSGNIHGFLRSSGGSAYTTIDDPLGVHYSAANGINGAGQIVGDYTDSSNISHGFLRSADGSTYNNFDDSVAFRGIRTTGINGTGQVVGYFGDSSGINHGFLRSADGSTYTALEDPLGVRGTVAFGIDGTGQVVGAYLDSAGIYHGFLRSANGSAYTTLDAPLAAHGTQAYGINAEGQVVGTYLDSAGIYHGFLRSADGSTYITLDDPLGVQGSAAAGINDAGQVVGTYYDSAGMAQGFIATPRRTDLVATSAVANGFGALDVNYTIANATAMPFDVGFYTSDDGAFDSGDALQSTVTISNPADLTVGAHTKSFTIGGGSGQVALPGMGKTETDRDYHLLTVLDPTNAVAEEDGDPFNEDNTVGLTGAYHPAAGPVFVHGTLQSDTVAVANSGANLVITTSASGGASTTLTYAAADVASIRVRSEEGADTIDGSATSKPMVVFAGSDDDHITCGSGNDWAWGGSGNDWISGLGGNDSLYGAAGGDSVYGGAGNDVIDAGGGNDLVDGGVGNDTIYGDTEGDTTTGGSGNDTLVGPDVHNEWVLGGYDAGWLNGGAFSAIEGLTGGAGQDDFSIRPGGMLTGKVDGKAGLDSLEYDQYFAPVMVNLQAKTATGVAGFLNMEWVVGSPSFDTLIGPNAATTWTVTGGNAGTAGAMNFGSFENLAGGSGTDTFKFNNGKNVSGVIDGGGGVNTLDYSAYTAAVVVNLALGTATNTGGVTGIQNVTGGSGGDTLIGDEDDNILLGNGGNDSLDGGLAGNDILVGGTGNDSIAGSRAGRSLLIGGAGRDVLTGGTDEDLLINGTTSYDANTSSLSLILKEWKRTDLAYAQRVDHLIGAVSGGLNGSVKLTTTTVRDDADADVDSLTGGLGLDWFWAPLGEVIDGAAQERFR